MDWLENAWPAVDQMTRRIGVLTGGGDCPGLNAVIRAVVKTATGVYHWEVTGIENGFEGLIVPEMTRPLTVDDVRGLLPRGGTILGTTNRVNPFAYRSLAPDRRILEQDMSDVVVQRVRSLELDALLVIGGDGSLHIALELAGKGVPIVGIPKTIDNDVLCTDVTFGFDTALTTATEAIDKLHTTAESHHRVMIVEVMGRHAGWLALRSGLAGGADVILIPEIPFDVRAVVDKVAERRARGRMFSIVVVAEGCTAQGGNLIYQPQTALLDSQSLGGVGAHLAHAMRELCDYEVRVAVLGHIQRGGSPTAFDRILATRFGAVAVRTVFDGNLGQMVALQGDEIVTVPIAEAVASMKQVPGDCELLRTACDLGVCLGV